MIAAVAAAIVFALGNFVAPNTRPMTIRLPPSRIEPQPVVRPPPPAPPAPVVEEALGAGEGAATP